MMRFQEIYINNKKNFILRLLAFFMFAGFILPQSSVVYAQAKKDVTYSFINISVNVMSNITVSKARDIQLKVLADNKNEVEIDPILDAESGMFAVSGVGNAPLRISYPKQIVLRNTQTGQTILFRLLISGGDSEEQQNSKMLNSNPINVTFSPQGNYFFWIGGKSNIKNAPEGNYYGNISFGIDYN